MSINVPLQSLRTQNAAASPVPQNASIEHDRKLAGYNRLATTISYDPDLAVFRRFMSLKAYTLLFLQAELHHLQYGLAHEKLVDIASVPAADDLSRHDRLFYRFFPSDAEDSIHVRTIRAIIEKQKEYDEALLRYHRILQLPRAHEHDTNNMRKLVYQMVLEHRDTERSAEHKIWDENFAHDLVSLKPGYVHRDSLTRFLNTTLIAWLRKYLRIDKLRKTSFTIYDQYIDSDDEDYHVDVPLEIYSEDTIARVARFIGAFVASLLPALSSLILYFIQRPLVRVSMILVFSVVFSLAVTVLTSAGGAECFAGTAAFAAVLVVFVSGNAGPTNVTCTCT